MSLPQEWTAKIRLPVICAPMYQVSTQQLVIAARKAGIAAGLPRANAPNINVFRAWLEEIMGTDTQPYDPPLGVNLSTRMPQQEMEEHLALCKQMGVDFIISATGDPTRLIQTAKQYGLKTFADAINLRFARKSIEAGAEGIIAIGAGGGGHSGRINHLTLLSAIRKEFDGTVVMAGAVMDGKTIRAAEILGADMVYMGTRFIASHESAAPDEYKQILLKSGVDDLLYTDEINGVHANWLTSSLEAQGLQPDNLPTRDPHKRGHDHLPPHIRPWKNIWSAGQGVEHIHTIQTVDQIVNEIESEYVRACKTPILFGKD